MNVNVALNIDARFEIAERTHYFPHCLDCLVLRRDIFLQATHSDCYIFTNIHAQRQRTDRASSQTLAQMQALDPKSLHDKYFQMPHR